MALRTINNALTTLRTAKIILSREVTEKQPIDTEKLHIDPKKPSIDSKKTHIGDKKQPIGGGKLHIGEEELHIESALPELDITQPTKENILKLLQGLGTAEIFGRSDICKVTGLQKRAASYLISTMLRHCLLDTVKGHGKGKYRFRSTI